MAHLLLSLVFLALLGIGFRSIWHDLTRPLVMQPWGDEVMAVALPLPARTAPLATAASVTLLNPAARREADLVPVQTLPLAA